MKNQESMKIIRVRMIVFLLDLKMGSKKLKKKIIFYSIQKAYFSLSILLSLSFFPIPQTLTVTNGDLLSSLKEKRNTTEKKMF